MFETSAALSRFSAGSGIDAVESRVRRLQALIQTMEEQRQKPSERPGGGSFQSFLGNASPPPKVQPLAGSVKERFETIQPLVQKYAAEFGVDPGLVNALIRQESNFNPNTVSQAGARGLMQLMPATAKGLGVSNPFDPEQNLAGGIRHLAGLLQKYSGNVALALAAYNAGGGAVDKHHGIPPFQETQHYVRRVLAAYLQEKNSSPAL